MLSLLKAKFTTVAVFPVGQLNLGLSEEKCFLLHGPKKTSNVKVLQELPKLVRSSISNHVQMIVISCP